jgi:hypothetical protein
MTADTFFMFADLLLLCCQIWNLYNLVIGSSVNCIGLTLIISTEKILVVLKMVCCLRLACEDLLLTVNPKAPSGCINDFSSKELIILLKQTQQDMCSFHFLPNFCAFTLIASQRVVLRFWYKRQVQCVVPASHFVPTQSAKTSQNPASYDISRSWKAS